MTCLAIDDEPLALQKLVKYIEKVPYLELVRACHSALEAREVLRDEVVDCIFVDINMPDLNGLDFVRQLAAPPLVVFSTAYSEYAIEGYKVDAVDYLLKPYGLDDFMRAAGKVQRQWQLRQDSMKGASGRNDTAAADDIYLKTDYRTVRVAVADITYVEGMGEYVRVHVSGQEKPVMALLALKRLEETLPAGDFVRIHKSYIINLRHLRETGRGRVVLDDSHDLPIGDSYRADFTTRLAAQTLGK